MQACIAVAVTQVGAGASITFSVHLQLEYVFCAQREHMWTLLRRLLHFECCTIYDLMQMSLPCRLAAHRNWL